MQVVPFIMSQSKAAFFPRKSAPLRTSGGKCCAQEYHTRDTVFNHRFPQRVHFYKICLWKEIITYLVLRPITKQLRVFETCSCHTKVNNQIMLVRDVMSCRSVDKRLI